MNRLWYGTLRLLGSTMLFVYVLCGPICVRGQQTPEKWERVYTGEGSIIELNVSSVKFQPDRILRAQYRTILSTPESLRGIPETKYKSRLEFIDFKLNEARYRFPEITLLDRHGKVVHSYTTSTPEDWRVIKPGGVTERLFNAACSSTLLGNWKTVAYRLAEGNSGAPGTDLDRLIGTRVRLCSECAEVGVKVCNTPAFESKRATQEELLRDLGVDLKALGIKSDYVETVNVRCDGTGWQPPTSLLLKITHDEMLMLWDGVFLVLKRDDQGIIINSPVLKRRGPA